MRKRFIIEVEVNPTVKRTHEEWCIILQHLLMSSETTYHADMHIYTAKVIKRKPK